jgi:branched-chain amino acid transport system permease protein
MYIIVQNLISFVWGDEVIKLGNNSIIVGNNILGAYVTNIQMLTFAICVILIITILIFLEFNTIGLIIRGVSANEELSNIQGINSNIIILYTICICSCIGSIAGVLISFDTGITPSIGFTLLLYGVIAMIIGGVGSTWGLIGGALLVATAQQLTAYFIDIKWIDAVTNLILIFFLILKPLGISGKHLKKTEI